MRAVTLGVGYIMYIGICVLVELRPRQRHVMNHMDHVLCMGMCVCFGGFIVHLFFSLFFLVVVDVFYILCYLHKSCQAKES